MTTPTTLSLLVGLLACTGSSPPPATTATGATSDTSAAASTVEVPYYIWDDAAVCWQITREQRDASLWASHAEDDCNFRIDTGWGWGPETVYWSTKGYCVMFVYPIDEDKDWCYADDPEFEACDESVHPCCAPVSWDRCPQN